MCCRDKAKVCDKCASSILWSRKIVKARKGAKAGLEVEMRCNLQGQILVPRPRSAEGDLVGRWESNPKKGGQRKLGCAYEREG